MKNKSQNFNQILIDTFIYNMDQPKFYLQQNLLTTKI